MPQAKPSSLAALWILAIVAVLGWRMTAVAAGTVLTLAPIPPPALPAPTGPPEIADSYVRLVAGRSFDTVRRALERVLPRELSTGRAEELAHTGEVEEDEAESPSSEKRFEGDVRYRTHIWRDPVRLKPRRDSLWIQIPMAYTVAVRGEGFEPTGCGSEAAPERGEIGCLTRLGWRDDWGVATLSNALPATYARRCKPKPPGLNFTQIVDRTIQKAVGARLSATADSLFAVWPGPRPVIEASWSALETPLELSPLAVFLDWDPQGARVRPIVANGDSVLVDASFVVRPRLVTSTAVGKASPRSRPLPTPQVRLARDELRIPFDFEIPCDTLAARVRAIGNEPGATILASEARVRAGGDRVLVTLGLQGAVRGEIHLVGELRFDSDSLRLEVPDLAPSAETERALRRFPESARREIRILTGRIESALSIELRDDVVVWTTLISRAFHRPVTDLVSLEGGINRRDVAGTYGSPEAIGVRLVAAGHAHVVLSP